MDLADSIEKALNQIHTDYDGLETDTLRGLIGLLQELRKDIAGAILDAKDFELIHLTRIKQQISEAIDKFEAAADSGLQDGITSAFDVGAKAVITPLDLAGYSVSPISTDLLTVLYGFSATLIQNISGDMRMKIDNQIRLASLGGKSPFETMQSITDILGVKARDGTWAKRPDVVKGVAARAETITRTELIRVFNMAHQEQASTVPGLQKRWLATLDNRTRETHVQAHLDYFDNPIPVDQPFIVGGESLMYPGDPSGSAEETVNCLLPGNMVITPRLEAISRALYRGPALEITTELGNVISVTPNHPILTRKGFIAAQFLNKGDYVICTPNSEQVIRSIDPDNDDMPTLIEQIWSSVCIRMLKWSSSTFSVMSHDFHCDAKWFVDSNVNIVRSDSFLRSNIKSGNTVKQFDEKNFGGGLILERNLAGYSPFTEFTKGSLFTPNSGMGSTSQDTSFGRSHIFHSNAVRLANASRLDTSIEQVLTEGGPTYPNLSREFLFCLSHLITDDKIVKIRNYDFCGHVYDLQDYTGLYISNRLVVKNCRCREVMVIPEIGVIPTALDKGMKAKKEKAAK